jgi:hypothetical protein
MNSARGGGSFFRISFTGVITLGIALASSFFEAGIFLGYTGRSLNAGGRLLRKGSIFAITCLLVTIIISLTLNSFNISTLRRVVVAKSSGLI